MRAIRAMVCVCGLFAFTDKVIGNPQIATFAAFGSFATLVLASFAGTWRDKLLAHLALALTGSVLITIATIVSSTTWLAAIVTVPATFAVFFAGLTGPNAASGVTGALLAWVLPAASVGTVSMVPDRLIGWWMASVCGTAPVLLFSPRSSGGNQLNAAASALAGKLADVLDASDAWRADQSRTRGDGRRQARLDRPVHVDALPPYRPGCDRPGARELRRVARVGRGADLRRRRGAARPQLRAGARPRAHRGFERGAARRGLPARRRRRTSRRRRARALPGGRPGPRSEVDIPAAASSGKPPRSRSTRTRSPSPSSGSPTRR